MRTPLVGGTGLLGKALSQSLQARGAQVLSLAKSGQADFVANVTSTSSLNQTLAGERFDAIIHLDGMTDVVNCQRRPEKALVVNSRSVQNSIMRLRNNSPKALFIFISTDQVCSGAGPHAEHAAAPIHYYPMCDQRSQRQHQRFL